MAKAEASVEELVSMSGELRLPEMQRQYVLLDPTEYHGDGVITLDRPAPGAIMGLETAGMRRLGRPEAYS